MKGWQCGGCRRWFISLDGFDNHRRGPYTRDSRHNNAGRCVDPASLGYVEQGGYWYSERDLAKAADIRARQVPHRPRKPDSAQVGH
jgi:hypothetical protein